MFDRPSVPNAVLQKKSGNIWKWLEMAGNNWKLMEMAGNGRRCVGITGYGFIGFLMHTQPLSEANPPTSHQHNFWINHLIYKLLGVGTY